MFPAPALPRTTLNVPASCAPVQSVTFVDAPAVVAASASSEAARTMSRTTLVRYRLEQLVEERRRAHRPVRVDRIPRNDAETGPAELLVEAVGDAAGDRVKKEQRLAVEARFLLEALHQEPADSGAAPVSADEQLDHLRPVCRVRLPRVCELHRADELVAVERREEHARTAFDLREERLEEGGGVVVRERDQEADRIAVRDRVGEDLRELGNRGARRRLVEAPYLRHV